MQGLPRVSGDGLFTVMLRTCTAEVLRDLLDPEAPYVWVVAHHPHRSLQWWTCSVPLGRDGRASPIEVRALAFDLLMPTSEFLARLGEFDGVSAHQMRRKVPDTLTIEGLDDRNRVRILIQNGLVASFYLPHAGECAWFATVDRRTMDAALARESIRALAY